MYSYIANDNTDRAHTPSYYVHLITILTVFYTNTFILVHRISTHYHQKNRFEPTIARVVLRICFIIIGESTKLFILIMLEKNVADNRWIRVIMVNRIARSQIFSSVLTNIGFMMRLMIFFHEGTLVTQSNR